MTWKRLEEYLELVQMMLDQVCIKHPTMWVAPPWYSHIFCLHSVVVDETTTATMTTLEEDQDVSITLPASLFGRLNTTDVVGIAITFYSDSSLFPLPEDPSSNSTIGSPVIGALVGGQTFSNLSENITIFFRLTQPVCMLSFHVVCFHFWVCIYCFHVELNKFTMCNLELYCCR